MAVDGLGNIFGIPVVKKEQEAEHTKRRNREKDQKREKKKEQGEQKEKEGRVDIRI